MVCVLVAVGSVFLERKRWRTSTSIAVTLFVDPLILIDPIPQFIGHFQMATNNKQNYDGPKYDSFATILPYLVGEGLTRSRSIIGFGRDVQFP